MKLHFLFITFLLPVTAAWGQRDPELPVATVNLIRPEVITQGFLSDGIDMLEAQNGQAITVDQRFEILNSIIDTRLVLQAAERERITVTDTEIRAAVVQYVEQLAGQQLGEAAAIQLLEQEGTTYEMAAEQIEKQLILQRYMVNLYGDQLNNPPDPTEAEIQQVFNENSTDFVNGETVRFDQIFLSTAQGDRAAVEQRGQGLLAQVRTSPSSFASLAAQHSEDPSSSNDGGDVGYVPINHPLREQWGQSFFTALFGMNIGEIVLLESNLGFHIVQMREKLGRRLLALNDPVMPGQTVTVRQYIINYLRQQRQNQMVEQYTGELVQTLRDEATINIIDANVRY